MEPLSKLAEFIPFMLNAGKTPHMNVARMVESVVIALMVAGSLKFFSIDALKAEVASLSGQITQLSADMKQMRSDLYMPRNSK
jgi:outer membrane murein-binding lipoprotein Lpp